MFRRTLLCSLGLGLAFSLAGVGAAYAEDPTPTPPPPSQENNSNGNSGAAAQNNGGLLGNVGSGNQILSPRTLETTPSTTTPAPTTATTPPVTVTPTPRNCGINGRWDDRLRRCVVFGDRFDGRVIIIDGGPRLDVCGFDNYGVFRSRNGVYGDRLDRLFGTDRDRRFVDLRRSCTVTTTNGDCTTVTTYFNDYRNTVNRWNDLSRRYNTADLVRLHRGELDVVYRERLRLADQFNRTRSTVRTVCQAPTTINNITVSPPPVTYTAPVYTAPAPVYSVPAPGGQVSTIPRGSIETGDGSATIVPLG